MRALFSGLQRRRILVILFLIIISIPTFSSILNGNFFPIHDDQSVARLYLLDQGIHQGVLYPRWVGILGFGFGYPLFNFYPPLVYYVGQLFHIVGFSYIWSVKLVMITGLVLGTIGMYFLARKFISEVASLVASVFYTYFTYHAVVGYVRGALAEFFTFAILPFLFISIVNLARKPALKTGLLFGICLALLILAHPLIALPSLFYIGFFFLFYFLFRIKQVIPDSDRGSDSRFRGNDKVRFVKHAAIGFILGLALSSFFWLPSLVEKQYTLTDNILTTELANYKIHFVYPFQFYFSQWGYGGSIEGPFDGVSFQLGKIHIGLAGLATLMSFIYLLFSIRHSGAKRSEAIESQNKRSYQSLRSFQDDSLRQFYFLLFLLLFSLFMSTYYSQPVWDKISFLWFLQFPWRFLTFTGVFIALVGAYSIEFLQELLPKKQAATYIILAFTVCVCSLAIATYQKYFKPQSYIQVTDLQKTSYEEIAWRVSRSSFEFIPKGVVTKKSELNTTIPDIDQQDIARESFRVLSGEGDIQISKNKFHEKEFAINSREEALFRLNTFNFPGWRAYLNDNPIKIDDNNGYKLITVAVPAGEHRLLFRFEDTLIRKVANTVSLLTFLGILIYFLKYKLHPSS